MRAGRPGAFQRKTNVKRTTGGGDNAQDRHPGWLVGLNLDPQRNFVAIVPVDVIGAIAVAWTNHRVSASMHHIDAVTEREKGARRLGPRLTARRSRAAPLEA
jgi:hypothetical protein